MASNMKQFIPYLKETNTVSDTEKAVSVVSGK